jgi:ssDNA-binding Zn-finger/Zn-ribbon topoisomerase 1
MIVEIPKIAEHWGSPTNLMTIEIQDTCPKCGAKRGVKRWKGFSYDGSRRLGVDCWENECGHIDTYPEVREEYWQKKQQTTNSQQPTEKQQTTNKS